VASFVREFIWLNPAPSTPPRPCASGESGNSNRAAGSGRARTAPLTVAERQPQVLCRSGLWSDSGTELGPVAGACDRTPRHAAVRSGSVRGDLEGADADSAPIISLHVSRGGPDPEQRTRALAQRRRSRPRTQCARSHNVRAAQAAAARPQLPAFAPALSKPLDISSVPSFGGAGGRGASGGRAGRSPSGLCALRGALLPADVVPIVAGSLGGAIGVGAAFPFDTLKTKAQTVNSEVRQAQGMLTIASRVVRTEGISGFYGGVSTMMVGQAFIKALAFSCNDWALHVQGASSSSHTLTQLCAAALVSGFVTSFLVNPFERVKILCQAEAAGTYKNGLVCAQEIIATDGVAGFLGRGLGPTLLRETPSYGLYFVLYSLLMESPVAALGVFAPLLSGALAGCGAWIPVYPIDVVKTQIQNTAGKEKAPSAWAAARVLYAQGGPAIFWDGLESKMLR